VRSQQRTVSVRGSRLLQPNKRETDFRQAALSAARRHLHIVELEQVVAVELAQRRHVSFQLQKSATGDELVQDCAGDSNGVCAAHRVAARIAAPRVGVDPGAAGGRAG